MNETHFSVICDSSIDLPQETVDKYKINVVPYLISFDGKEYLRENVDISVSELYGKMKADKTVFPKTSMPSMMDYYDVMKKTAETNTDILCMCMSGDLTSSVQSAENAAMMIREEYPGIQVHVMDSRMATALQGLYVVEAAKLRDRGYTLSCAIDRLLQIQGTGHIIFTMNTLDYLVHGGRIGKLKGLIANVLSLKPLVSLVDGALNPLGVIRTRKQSLKRITDLYIKYIEEKKIDFDRFILATGSGYDRKEGLAFHETVKKALKEKFGYEEEMVHYQIGATIGVYTGPDPIGVGLLEKA